VIEVLNLTQADWFKLRKSPALKIMLAVTTACAAVMALFAYAIPRGTVDAALTGLGFMFSDVNVISIVGAVMASLLICGDFDHKTIHDAIAGGHSRKSIIGSKAIVLSFALALLLLPYALVTGVAIATGKDFGMGGVAVGFLHVLSIEAGSALSAAEAAKLVLVSLVMCFVYAAQISVCIPLAFALKKPLFVIAIYYGFSILSAQLIAFARSNDVFDRLFSFTPFGGNHAFLTLDSGAGDIIQALLVSAVFIAAMSAVTYGAFRRAEIK